MTILLPRLPGPVADQLLEHMLLAGELRWSGFSAEALPEGVRYAATGGSTATTPLLHEIRSGIVGIARKFGFGSGDSNNNHAGFDAALAGWLADREELFSGEALRDDVWTFIGVVMAPDVVHWRFGKSRERYLGGIRNTFQRLWLRASVLDRGLDHPDRWGLLEHLTEDALVQITERPSIGADPILACELAEAWVRTSAKIGRTKMEPVMRLATLRLRIRNEIQALSDLPDHLLVTTIDEFFERAVPQAGTGASQSIRQATGSSSSSDEGDDPASSEAPRTRRRSWAIWRAR